MTDGATGDRLESTNLEAFFMRYRDAWMDITPERLLSFWHPHGTVMQPATGEVATPRDLAARIGTVKAIFRDLRLTPVRWATTGGDTIFIHWKMTATFNAKPLEWSGVDIFTVTGERAETGVSHSDPANLVRQISPETAIPDLFTVLATMMAQR